LTSRVYLPEIDGLRAIAVLAVVLYHAGAGPASGYAGVDMFFVISGYLITWLLLQERQAQGRIHLLAFYARRVRRILPAATLVILSTVGGAWLMLPPTQRQQVCESAVSGLLFFANIFFLRHSGGYFDHPSVEMPLIHLWSLSVEEQFYVLWPLFLILFTRVRAGFAAITGALLALASLAFAEYLIEASPDAAFYLMPARFWELAAGGLIAFAPVRGAPAGFMAPLGLAGLIAGLVVPTQHFPALGALPVVAGTALLLWMIHAGSRLGPAGAVLRFAPINFVGRISYSLYLWHWPLLALYHATSVGSSVKTSLALCGFAVLLAALTLRYVETPARRLPLAQSRGMVVATGVAAMLGMAVTVIALSRFVFPVVPPAPALATATGSPIQEKDFATRIENDLTPIHYKCLIASVRPPDQFPDASCATQPGVAPKMAVIGDSYGGAWQSLGFAIGAKLGLSTINYSRAGCPILLTGVISGNPARDALCGRFNVNVIKRVQGFDTIFIANRWDVRDLAINQEGIRAVLAELAPTVRKIYILGPTPAMRDRVPKCIRANQIDACGVPRKEFEKNSAPMRNYLLSQARQYKNVELIDASNFLCTKDLCPPVKDGLGLYIDDYHVTYSAARKFAAEFATTIK
jgi:peptidoglycan/LPS O-acetylase OafA/YrhL